MQNREKIISNYLSGKMSGQERQSFEKKLNEDDNLSAETNLFLLEKLAFEDHLREKMQALEAEYQEEQAGNANTPAVSPRIGLPLLAGIIIFVLTINGVITWLIHREFQQRTITAAKLQNVKQDSTIKQLLQQQQSTEQTLQLLLEEIKELKQSGQRATPNFEVPETKPPVAYNDGFKELKRKLQLAAGDVKNLSVAVAEQRTYLLTLDGGEESWESSLLRGNYKAAWSLLEPIVKDKQNSPEFRSSPFYYAALLKLYWNPKIDIDAAEILQQITLEQLQSDLPEIKETTLWKHRIVALYDAGKTEEANRLLEMHKKLLN